MQFIADPRNGSSLIDPCGKGCCCAEATIMPGETARVDINYAGWMASIAGRSLVGGRTDIAMERIAVSGPLVGSDLAFTLATPGSLTGSAALQGDLAGASYALAVPPKFGSVALSSDGTFTYTVSTVVAKPDMFMVGVTMGGRTIMRRVGIELVTSADFKVLVTPGRPYAGSLVAADTPPGARFVLAGASTWSPVYNGPQTPVGDPPNDIASLLAQSWGFVTAGQTLSGSVQVGSDGRFFFAPFDHTSGVDGFAVDVYDADGVFVACKVAAIDIPALWIERDRIDIRGPFLNFPLSASRDARIGDATRITVFQDAITCDGCPFTHVSCYDITVARC